MGGLPGVVGLKFRDGSQRVPVEARFVKLSPLFRLDTVRSECE